MIEGLISSAERLEAVLTFGAVLAGVIVLVKLMKHNDFKVWGVSINLGYAWIIFAALTIAHIYTSIRFVQRCYSIAYDSSVSDLEAWNNLTNGELLWFDGLIARVEHISGAGGITIYQMDFSDLTTWLAHLGAIAMFLAIVRIRKSTWKVKIASTLCALLITFTNWIVGSNWVIAASELTVEPSERLYLPRLHENFGQDH